MAEFEISNAEELDTAMQLALQAHFEFLKLDQEQVDKIFYAAAFAANTARIPLAQMAVKDTGMGVVEDKVIKNNYASEYIYNYYKHTKTAGLISEDKVNGNAVYAEPLGILAGIIPTTNPTSTIIYKCLMALKTRNVIVISPHHRAVSCSIEAARVVRDAAVAAGAPKNCIIWITQPRTELSGMLMKHKLTSCILATGGPGMVSAAYSSGNPALGVGPGNNCAIVDELCNLKDAVNSIIQSKTFDNGMICASEQSCAIVDSVFDEAMKEFAYRGCYIMNEEETMKVGDFMLPMNEKTGERRLNPTAVGKSARNLAERAGISVPADHPCKVLIGMADPLHIDKQHPMCMEKLSPILGVFRGKDFSEALSIAKECIDLAGKGHTGSLHTSEEATDRIEEFAKAISAGRLIVNQPSAQGAIGDLYNFTLAPTFTIGCGSHGKNSVSENVQCKHLLNYKTVTLKRENCLWFKNPPKVYFKYGCTAEAVKELYVYKRVMVITGKILYSLGYADSIIKPLEAHGVKTCVFFDVAPDPTLECCEECLKVTKTFEPDAFIAIGGGSVMDLMKLVRLQYEHGDSDFVGLAERFMDIRKRIYEFPELLDMKKVKTYSVCVPTSSGTGSEVTPFAVITDEKEGVKYPLADYMLTPEMAIVDSALTLSMPKHLAAWTGIDALTHAIESYVSVLATEFTQPISLEAIKMVFENLDESVNKSTKEAREAVHHAATLAGMAFANAFLGICHSMAHKLGEKFHIPHGLANAICLIEVIKYNACEQPTRMGTFPEYKFPCALKRYNEIADYLGLEAADDTQMGKVNALCNAIWALYDKIGCGKYVVDFRHAPTKEEYFAAIPYLAYHAFDDQCTGANPRYPLMPELEELFKEIYEPKK